VWFCADAPEGFLVHSFAGDDPLACRDHVRGVLGLDPWQPRNRGEPRRQLATATVDREAHQRREVARSLFARARPGIGSLAETYLESRGIALDAWPDTLRFLPASPPAHLWPTMVAAYGLPDEPEPGIIALRPEAVAGVQLTYLAHDGRGKAPIDPQKRSIGRGHDAPIVLAPMNVAGGLVIAEGIEDALSLHVATGLGAWAAGGASRMPALAAAVPEHCECVTIAADSNDAGRAGAAGLRERLVARGIDVEVIFLDEPEGGRDGS
jgi:hypothetical protein